MKTTLDKSGTTPFRRNWTQDSRALAWQLLVVSVFLLMQPGIPSAANAAGPIVTVSTVEELQDAVESGASKIRIEPGDYTITQRIFLSDVKIEGLGGNVNDPSDTRPIVNLQMDLLLLLDDEGIYPFGGSIFVVSGKTSFTNIKFTGIDVPGAPAFPYKGNYIQSANNAPGKHKVTVENCRFISAFFHGYSAIGIGNSYFTSLPSEPPIWEAKITDSYFEGSAYGIDLQNRSDKDYLAANNSSEATINATVSRNEFFLPFVGLFAEAGTSRDNGIVRLKSSDNKFESWLGLVLRGGSEEFFSYNDNPGGSFNKTTVESKRDRFVNAFLAVEVMGAKRHADSYGPSMGNEVDVKIISPVFELDKNFPRLLPSGFPQFYFRDINIIGSLYEGSLPANAIDESTEGPGNFVEVKLLNSDFQPGTGLVWIKKQAIPAEIGAGCTSPPPNGPCPVPAMDPEPNSGNNAMFDQTRSSFDETNGPVNQGSTMIPDEYFKGRWD